MRVQLLAVALIAAAAATAAQAETLRFHATLNGASEVPPNTTTGTGQATATLDTATKVLTYDVTYSGLTGPATAAHFHGPAEPGVNAPPVVTVMGLQSPMSGKATLTDAQISDLRAGKWYFNVHTMAHMPGEIRGQVVAAK